MEKKEVGIKAYNVSFAEGKLVFVSMENNIIYSLDIEEKKTCIWNALPEEKMFDEMLYGNIHACETGIFLAPLNAEHIWFYDYEFNKWQRIICDFLPKDLAFKIYGIFENKGYVYMFGFKYPGIIKISIYDRSVKLIDLTKLVSGIDYIGDGLFNWDFVTIGDFLYTPVLSSNKLLKMNLCTDEIELIQCGTVGYIGATLFAEKIWLVSRCGAKCAIFDTVTQECVEIQLENNLDNKEYCFGGAFVKNEKIVFTSFIGKTIEINPKDMVTKMTGEEFMFHKYIEGVGEVTQNSSGNIIIYGEKGEQILDCKISSEELKHIYDDYDISKLNSSSGIVKESSVFSLEYYLMALEGKL